MKGKKQTLYLIGPLLNTAVRCESAVRLSASACNAGYRADRTVSLDVHGTSVQRPQDASTVLYVGPVHRL